MSLNHNCWTSSVTGGRGVALQNSGWRVLITCNVDLSGIPVAFLPPWSPHCYRHLCRWSASSAPPAAKFLWLCCWGSGCCSWSAAQKARYSSARAPQRWTLCLLPLDAMGHCSYSHPCRSDANNLQGPSPLFYAHPPSHDIITGMQTPCACAA